MSVRAFLALELPPEAKQAIATALGPTAERCAGLRRTALEGLHLTLRFLGETSPEQIEALVAELAPEAARCVPAAARVAGLGLFPERGAPRILWLAVELSEPFLELQRACEAAACRLGFEPEPRPFRPHLTLGRWRERVPRPELAPLGVGPVRLDRLVLFRSRLDARSAVYTPLHTFALGATTRDRGLLDMPHSPGRTS